MEIWVGICQSLPGGWSPRNHRLS